MISDEAIGEAIAGRIADRHATPATLVVGDFRRSLTWILEHEQKYLTRDDLKQKLGNLSQAIERVCDAVSDFQIQQQLLFGDAVFDHQYEMIEGLKSLAARTNIAIAGIREGKGRDKHYSRTEGLSAQVVCALMVAILWRFARGKWPPHNNKPAQEACLALWLSAGGAPGWNEKSGKSLDTWRDHLKAAKKAEGSPEAAHLAAMARNRGIIGLK